ncbi:MAG: response regulator [bacterium]|nr:response regulator [bacterium]
MSETKHTILYVDDEDDNLVTFKSVFRREFKVLTAISGLEALEILKSHQVDLIISDQRMPAMTGVQLLKKTIIEYPESKRMILTGHSEMDDIIDAINLCKIDAYITKPWSKEGLMKTISEALEESSQIQNLNTRIQELEEENLKLKEKLNNVKP